MGLALSKIRDTRQRRMNVRTLMAGLDAAGKTTILYMLKIDRVPFIIPTIGFNLEVVEYKNILLTVWDIGGQDNIRSLWRHYFRNAQCIIFVVDSNDRGRVFEARKELRHLLNQYELQNAILLVLANKNDLPNAMDAVEVTDKLGLYSLRHRAWHTQSVCAISGDGLSEGLEWLATTLNMARYQELSATSKGANLTTGMDQG